MIDVDMLIDKIDEHDYGQWPEGPNAGELGRFALKAHEAMLKFVRRVEDGSIHSTKTYGEFRKILDM